MESVLMILSERSHAKFADHRIISEESQRTVSRLKYQLIAKNLVGVALVECHDFLKHLGVSEIKNNWF